MENTQDHQTFKSPISNPKPAKAIDTHKTLQNYGLPQNHAIFKEMIFNA